MQKNIYVAPVFDILEFDSADLIVTSNPDEYESPIINGSQGALNNDYYDEYETPVVSG